MDEALAEAEPHASIEVGTAEALEFKADAEGNSVALS